MLFTSIIGFINIKPKSHKSTMNKNMSFKKLRSSSKNTMPSGSYMTTSDDEHSFDTKITSDVGETVSNKFSPNITNESMPFYMGKSINKCTLFQIPL